MPRTLAVRAAYEKGMTMASNQPMDNREREERKQRFLQLLEPIYVRVERFAFAMTEDAEEGRDLVSETLLKAFEHFDEIRDEKAFLSYLFSIARRLHTRRHQRGLRFERFDSEQAEALHATDPQPDLAADIELLHVALRQLPARQRETIVLYELSGLSLAELREIQGGTLTALKVRLWRARRQLAKILGVDEKGGEKEEALSTEHSVESIASFPNDLQRALP